MSSCNVVQLQHTLEWYIRVRAGRLLRQLQDDLWNTGEPLQD
jgi:hypothetical protein